MRPTRRGRRILFTYAARPLRNGFFGQKRKDDANVAGPSASRPRLRTRFSEGTFVVSGRAEIGENKIHFVVVRTSGVQRGDPHPLPPGTGRFKIVFSHVFFYARARALKTNIRNILRSKNVVYNCGRRDIYFFR